MDLPRRNGIVLVETAGDGNGINETIHGGIPVKIGKDPGGPYVGGNTDNAPGKVVLHLQLFDFLGCLCHGAHDLAPPGYGNILHAHGVVSEDGKRGAAFAADPESFSHHPGRDIGEG